MRLARLRLTLLSDSDTCLGDFGPACTVSVAWPTLAARLILILLTLDDQLKLMLRTWALVQLMQTRSILAQLTP